MYGVTTTVVRRICPRCSGRCSPPTRSLGRRPADPPEQTVLVDVWKDSFERVKGEKAELNAASGPTVIRADKTGPIEIAVVNGTERDRQTVYYDATGSFLRVS